MTRPCAVCHGPMPARVDARYCSTRCRVAAFRRRLAPGPTPNPIAAPGALQSLHCPACSRRVGRSDGVTLELSGRWTLRGDTWRWSAHADERRREIPLPAKAACQHCRHEIAA